MAGKPDGKRAGEYDEIIGYHLEQASRSLTELGPTSDAAQALGREGRRPPGRAAARAFASEYMPGTVSLLSRAVALLPDKDPGRLVLLPRLAFALIETGDFRRLARVIEETSPLADAFGDEQALAMAGVLEQWMHLYTDPDRRPAQARDAVRGAISTFEAMRRRLRPGQSLVATRVRQQRVRTVRRRRGGLGPRRRARTTRAPERRDELDAFTWGLIGSGLGPTPVEAGLARTDRLLEQARGDRKGMSGVLIMRALLTANLGRFDEARGMIAQAWSLCRDVGLTLWEAGPVTQAAGVVELLAGDAAAAETVLQTGADKLREMGEAGWLSTALAWLAEAAYLQGRADQAYQHSEESEHLAGGGDVLSRAMAQRPSPGTRRPRPDRRRGAAVPGGGDPRR